MNLMNTKAHVFQLELSEKKRNTMTAVISTYEGKREVNGEETNIYNSWFTDFVGLAFEKAQFLKDEDWIEITNAKVNSYYSKEKKSSYCKVTVFDFYKAEVPMKNNPDNAMEELKVSGKDSEIPVG